MNEDQHATVRIVAEEVRGPLADLKDRLFEIQRGKNDDPEAAGRAIDKISDELEMIAGKLRDAAGMSRAVSAIRDMGA